MSAITSLRLPAELRARLDAVCAETGTGLSAEIVSRLEQSFAGNYVFVPDAVLSAFQPLAVQRGQSVGETLCQLAQQALLADAMLDEQDVADQRRDLDVKASRLQLIMLAQLVQLLPQVAGKQGIDEAQVAEIRANATLIADDFYAPVVEFEEDVRRNRLRRLGLSEEAIEKTLADQEAENG